MRSALSWLVLQSGTALVVPAGVAASGRATAGTTRAVPDCSTNHSSTDRIVVNSYNQTSNGRLKTRVEVYCRICKSLQDRTIGFRSTGELQNYFNISNGYIEIPTTLLSFRKYHFMCLLCAYTRNLCKVCNIWCWDKKYFPTHYSES